MPTLENVLDLLDLETLEENLFRGRSPQEEQQRVFGGQVAGQALVAAGRTVDAGRATHSLHSYFLRPGDPAVPIIYQVDRTRDGRSFTTRRVTAIQHGKPIFALSASFVTPDEGLERSEPMPDVPPPNEVPTALERIEKFGSVLDKDELAWLRRERAIEMRHLDQREYLDNVNKEPRNLIWIRTAQPIESADPLLHQCLIAYASDMTLVDTAMRPHLETLAAAKDVQVASLDHAMWFHRPCRADEWLLYDQESSSVSSSRGFTTAKLYRESGELVVSVAQESLMRLRDA
jgi:acyl-CoA thioesterase-2